MRTHMPPRCDQSRSDSQSDADFAIAPDYTSQDQRLASNLTRSGPMNLVSICRKGDHSRYFGKVGDTVQ